MISINKIISEPYPVYAGSGILNGFNNEVDFFKSYSNITILVDTNTRIYCLPRLQSNISLLSNANIITISSGEINKNIYGVIDIWKSFSEYNLDRNSLIINLGGGVVSDIGSFAASTFKRGLPYLNIPTTLLAMADASIGGKTGIDLFNYKNQIGTFASPKAVIVDSEFLATLTLEQVMNGYAEIIKHALIADKILWKNLRKTKIDNKVNWNDIIIKNLKIKHKICKNDPFEKGIRKLLNFGHTVGHAIESYSFAKGSRKLMHGEAVIIGMICEIYLSVIQNKFDDFFANEICSYLLLNFPRFPFPKKDIPEIINIMKQDKKNIDGKISFTLLRDIGEATINNYVEIDQIAKCLEYYLKYV